MKKKKLIIIRSVLNTICLPNCVVIFLPYIISCVDNYTTSTALPTLCSRFATLRSLSPRSTLATNHHNAITHTRAHQPPCCNTPPMFPSTTHPYTHNTPFPFESKFRPLCAHRSLALVYKKLIQHSRRQRSHARTHIICTQSDMPAYRSCAGRIRWPPRSPYACACAEMSKHYKHAQHRILQPLSSAYAFDRATTGQSMSMSIRTTKWPFRLSSSRSHSVKRTVYCVYILPIPPAGCFV